MAGKTGLVWDERFLDYDFGPQHPLRPVRVTLTYDLIRSEGILDQKSVQVVKPRLASREEILLFHEEDTSDLSNSTARKAQVSSIWETLQPSRAATKPQASLSEPPSSQP